MATPNALALNAEALGTRIRINGGTSPISFWMISSWTPDVIRDNDDDEQPMQVGCYETRELALECFEDDLKDEIHDWDEDDRAEVDTATTTELLRTQGYLGCDDSLDGSYVRLEEVVLWHGRQR